MRHKMIASWPGPSDRLRRPEDKPRPGDDDLRVSGERRLAMGSLAPARGRGNFGGSPRPRQGERGRGRGRKMENPLIEYRP